MAQTGGSFPKFAEQRCPPVDLLLQTSLVELLQERFHNSICKFWSVVSCASSYPTLTFCMFVPRGAPTSLVQHVGHALVCGHGFPAFVKKHATLGVSQIHLAAMSDSKVWALLSNQLLDQRQPPCLASFRKFPCDMYAALNTVLPYTTSTNVLTQGTFPFVSQFSDLLWCSLVHGLHRRVRATLWRYPHISRVQLVNEFETVFDPFVCF